MKFVCYSGWEQLPEGANKLFEKAEKESIFFSRPWFENLSATGLDEGQTMVLACVVAGNEVMAMLPMMKTAGATWHSLKHRYTPHYSLLLTDTDQQQVLACMAQGLRRLPIKGVLFEPVAVNDRKLQDLQHAMQTAGFSCEYIFRHYNWIYRVQEQSYEDYIAARPARLRNTIARKRRKLLREHGYEVRLFTGKEVPQAMADYYSVYNASWKAYEQYADFLDSVVLAFSEAGWSRLAILYIKGQPAAAQLWFIAHGKASIFRLAYDEAWRQYSTGSILTSHLMKYVIDTDKVMEIDFLTGNDAYKQDWMSERRERFALSCVKSVKSAGRCKQLLDSLKHMLRSQFNARNHKKP